MMYLITKWKKYGQKKNNVPSNFKCSQHIHTYIKNGDDVYRNMQSDENSEISFRIKIQNSKNMYLEDKYISPLKMSGKWHL